ncbi:DNA segregation ATPase, FtsK/SpoIIIE family [Rivularia sp. PCC 7116]|uniref:DNA translocase FtsK n=1 Tax=Rivularia sp. PCC 7116 TaxID=373994 RepID=UPI00029EC965|nr:DNA translocase FtsK [Rivularia sp. PCC 7116]AFY56556.1 DNA segregation ATPase, FtsK/SpoIIIE family [Rivularia sp. PCC 7116]
MHYLTDTAQIRATINQFRSSKILWLDTEVADCRTPNPRLSLIQVLANPDDSTGEFAYILDVLDKPDLARYFIDQIMVNPQIEKVFHNASFDLKYLGGKLIPNVTCTLKIARKITRYKLKTSNLKLKTLATELCQFTDVDTESGASDWGKRPLIGKQLYYAAMDVVYLAAVHRQLISFNSVDKNSILKMAANKNKLTVTKVRIAFECPRLFYINDKFGGKTLFLPKDTATGIGSVFHSFADEFVRFTLREPRFKELFKAEASQLDIEEVAVEMQQLFYKAKFYPYLQQVTKTDKSRATPLLLVWQGLQNVIKRFAQILIVNRGYCSGSSVIRKTFVSEARQLEHFFDLPNKTRQLIRGEYDCLTYNFERQRLCLLEFKTYQSIDPSAQLAQVSLYGYMLFQQKQVPVDSAVYCVLPEFKEYYYGWEELENTVNQLIPYKLQQMQEWLSWKPSQPNCPPSTTQPYLCEICPQQEKCQSYFGDSIEIPPTPLNEAGLKDEEDLDRENKKYIVPDIQIPSTPPEKEKLKEENSVNADATAEELVTTLQSFGINVDFVGAAVAPSFIRVKLKPQLGVKFNSIQKLYADLQIQMGLENPPLIAPQAGYVSVDLPNPNRKAAFFDDYLKPQKSQITASVKIAIGVNLEGKLVEADLSDPNTCHFLVGGTTGSGKSEFLRSQLLSLLIRYSPQQLKIALVDPKRVTFPEFEKMPWLYSSVVKDSEKAIDLMDKLVSEMEFRYQQFEKTECADLGSYNQRSDQPLARIVCIFDEYADFMAEKESRNALEQSIKRLGAMARAAGIHLIIATQRPEAKVVTPIIRSNLPGRVALRTASEADSTIVLGGKKTAAAYLLGKGDLLYQVGAKLHRLQSLYAKKIKLP